MQAAYSGLCTHRCSAHFQKLFYGKHVRVQSDCYFVNVISRFISLQLLCMQSAPFTLLV